MNDINAAMVFIAVVALGCSLWWLHTTKPTRRRVDIVVELGDVKRLADAIRGRPDDDAPTLHLPVCHEYEPEYGALGCWCGEYRDSPQHFR